MRVLHRLVRALLHAKTVGARRGLWHFGVVASNQLRFEELLDFTQIQHCDLQTKSKTAIFTLRKGVLC